MHSMLSKHGVVVVLIGALLSVTGSASANPCTVPEGPPGTVTLPPAGCEYLSPQEVHEILDGLPPGTTIEFAPIHKDFICHKQDGTPGFPNCPPPNICEGPNGSGGNVDCFDSNLDMQLQGTGALNGFVRTLSIPVSCQVQTGPRTPGDAVQTFPSEMFYLQGQLFGDPDFDQLTITGGAGFGLPSPGHTTLRDLGGGTFAVDSFFDITYRIDYVGAPGGSLAGMSGSTTATIRMSTGDGTALGGNCVQAGDDCWDTQCGATHVDFSANPIPPGFFDPGSDPFVGTIQLGGGAGAVDTVVRRLDKMCFPEPLPTSATVPVEIVALDLVSCQPIQVGNSGDWDVQVSLSNPQPQGQMTATKLDPNGGVFSATLLVQPVYTFTRVGNPGDIRVLDTGAMGMAPVQLHTAGNAPWSTDETFDQCTPDGFAAGFSTDDGTTCCVEVCHSSFGQAPHEHCTRPPECPECVAICQPDPTATACEPVACADTGDACLPRCVRIDPLTGQTIVLDCDCRTLNECRVNIDLAGTPNSGEPVLDGQLTPNPCVVADNGTGTVTLPPAGCEYLSPDEVHQILDGLPAGTTIEFAPIHKDFICEQNPTGGALPGCPPPGICEQPGGGLGGQTDCFISNLQMQVNGTGTLGGFVRTLSLPIACRVNTGPRTPGDPVQDFDTEMFFLQGALFGDPDFCTLRVTGGTGFGLPSPGHTTLTQLPGGQFNVDSFFDITYQIEFQGCPGSVLDGMAGTTTATIRMETGATGQGCIGDCPPGTTCVERRSVNANGTIDLCCDCIPDQPVTEACCFTDGTCTDMDAATCLANGGTPQGAGTDCTTVTCPGAPCEPLPDGSGCSNADCPDPAVESCLPRCVRTDPTTGVTTVIECDCRSPNECHVDFVADATGQSGQSGPVLDGQNTPNPCVVADNGTGTVTLPPLGCDYLSPDEVHEIIDGLPPGTTIELEPIHTPIFCEQTPGGTGFPGCPPPGVCEVPGGSLGGQTDCFSSDLQLQIAGTGVLAGFSRNLTVPVACQVESAPRNPGDPVQEFDTQMNFLQGELFGDPDFCTLRITGGTGFGLPSPGHTTLTELPSGDFAVDSFFDITYQIEFAGCPGSALDGYAGTTTATIRMQTGSAQSCVGACPPGTTCVETRTVNADGTIDTCCDCVAETCEPLPDGSGCSQVNCPPGMECVPTCSEVNLATGQVVVTACDCKPIDECHLELDATGVAGGSSGEVAESQAGSGNPCDVVDNGSGTVTLPPAGCEYLSPDEVHEILNGLPAGTTIEFAPIHKDFICGERADFPGCPPPLVGCEQPGGSQGGDIDCFESQLEMALQGTGALAGFNRNLSIPVVCQAETGPKSPGDDEQTFSTQMTYLQGELFGDPDFCLLRVTGGNGFGLPSPGQTTLTRLPNGNFAVDSFFDITYQIEFQGCPGSVLEGMAGTTTATIRMATGAGMPKCVGTCPNGTVCEEQLTQIGSDRVEVCCVCEDCVPEVVKAVSRAEHGNAGTFDIDINLTPPATTTEMRRCDKQIVVTFNVPVEPCDGTLDNEVAVNVGNITNLTLAGNELTIDLDNVPDPSCLRIHLQGFCCVGGTVPMAPRDIHLIILGGDVNLSGGVTIADMSAVKFRLTETTDATNFHLDVNCSGGLTIADMSAVKAKLTNSAPTPCP